MEWKTFFKISILLFILTSCTIKIPDIKITGEKTALENQVMGEYAKIKEDAWMVASERGDGTIKITADKREVVEAVRDREFLKDDILQLKLEGLIGETGKGLVEVVDKDKFSDLKKNKKHTVEIVLNKENKARSLIMERIIETDTKLNSSPEEVYKAFFIMNLDESPEDTYYRDKKGKWVRK